MQAPHQLVMCAGILCSFKVRAMQDALSGYVSARRYFEMASDPVLLPGVILAAAVGLLAINGEGRSTSAANAQLVAAIMSPVRGSSAADSTAQASGRSILSVGGGASALAGGDALLLPRPFLPVAPLQAGMLAASLGPQGLPLAPDMYGVRGYALQNLLRGSTTGTMAGAAFGRSVITLRGLSAVALTADSRVVSRLLLRSEALASTTAQARSRFVVSLTAASISSAASQAMLTVNIVQLGLPVRPEVAGIMGFAAQVALKASASAQSGAAGYLAQRLTFRAAMAAQMTVGARLGLLQRLRGTATATSTAAAPLRFNQMLRGAAGAQSFADGRWAVGSSLRGGSFAAASMSAQARQIVSLRGIASGAGGGGGRLLLPIKLRGAESAAAMASGQLKNTSALRVIGSAQMSARADGRLRLGQALKGHAQAQMMLAARLGSLARFSGLIEASPFVQANLRTLLGLRGETLAQAQAAQATSLSRLVVPLWRQVSLARYLRSDVRGHGRIAAVRKKVF
jgi:hypothetical protein